MHPPRSPHPRQIGRRFKATGLLLALGASLFIHFTVLFLLRPGRVRPIPPWPTAPPTEIDVYQLPAPSPVRRLPIPPASAMPPSKRAKAKGPVLPEPASDERLALLRLRLGASDAPLIVPKGHSPDEPGPKLYQNLLPSTAAESTENPINEAPLGLHAPTIPKDLVGSIAQEVLGPHRVQSGSVDPYFSKLQQTLTEIWRTDRSERKFFQPALKPASVRITQGRGGHLISAELLSSFNDPGWDRGLLSDLKEAAYRLPEPPDTVFAGHQFVSSSWSFLHSTTRISEFDIVNVFDKRAIPQPSNKHVVLLSVEQSN